jgi:catechol 2,3-dioxygenase-like lactoylglutathione lyase family enzyme
MASWFSYEYCTDIPATRNFYGKLIGLEQVWDEPDDVAFRHDCVQLSFHRVATVNHPTGWAFQPGWAFGQLVDTPATQRIRSISIALTPARFRGAVRRLQEAQVPQLRPAPFWVGYWSFVVRDPDGLTVELSDPESLA